MSNVIDLANRRRATGFPMGKVIALFVALLLFLVLFGSSLFSHTRLFLAQYSNDYYAFYLQSGNVFYGHVRGVGFGQVILTDAYSFQELEVGETTTSNLSAVRDNPLTSPDNWMVIPSRTILFYERIGEDASVLEALRAQ